MTILARPLLGLVLAIASPAAAAAQSAPAQSAPARGAAIDYRDEFLRHFKQSTDKIAALAEAMPESLYRGRDVGSWAVLFQLLAHMNEHVGQSIAYARMNGIVPPWSR